MPGPNRSQPPSIVAWLEGKTAEDLKAIRRGRHNLYPDAIIFYEADGTAREDAISIRVPTPDDRIAARVDAILYVSKKVPKALDFKVQTQEDARKFIGEVEFLEIDNAALAARCIHDPIATLQEGTKAPPPWKNLELLLTDHRMSEIMDVYERINLLNNTFSPRVEELTEVEMWMCARFIGERENASPLGAMRADTQLAFLIWACKRATREPLETSSSSTT